jgi:alkylation response protein AidB-like acyl-CoA dehydrogenase
MFTMMNAAASMSACRVSRSPSAISKPVTLPGSGCKAAPRRRGNAEALPIIHHPDVRRMLLWMRTATEAMRALAYYTAG